MRHALLLLLALTGLCSCGPKQATVIVTVPVALCLAPSAPVMPELNASLPLDSPENVEALMIRDDMFRAYAHGLRSALECYQAQVAPK